MNWPHTRATRHRGPAAAGADQHGAPRFRAVARLAHHERGATSRGNRTVTCRASPPTTESPAPRRGQRQRRAAAAAPPSWTPPPPHRWSVVLGEARSRGLAPLGLMQTLPVGGGGTGRPVPPRAYRGGATAAGRVMRAPRRGGGRWGGEATRPRYRRRLNLGPACGSAKEIYSSGEGSIPRARPEKARRLQMGGSISATSDTPRCVRHGNPRLRRARLYAARGTVSAVFGGRGTT